MSATQISVCSNALLALGGKAFSDFSERRDQVTLCSNVYPTVRDTVLRAHPWKCATQRVLLSPMTTLPAFDFAQQFMLPSDWLRTIQVGRKDWKIPFRAEGRKILANSSQLPLVYVFRNEVPGTWSTNLVHVMELAMMAKIAYAVTSSTSMRDSVLQEFERALKIAKAVDGQDDPPEEFDEGTFVESRFSGVS